MRVACALMSGVGDDVVAVPEVRGEHAVVSGEVGAGSWDQRGKAGDAKSAGLPIGTAGGCPEGVRHTDVAHEIEGVEDDVSGPVTEGVLESVDDLSPFIDREAFVGECRAGDVATQAFEGAAPVGMAHGANPRLHHSGGLCRENPESWAMQGICVGARVATVCRVRALRPAWGPVAMR